MPNISKLYEQAVALDLFDAHWYASKYKLSFASEHEAFTDYLRKSPYVDVSPSPNFNSACYLRDNIDVYHSGLSPLRHYLSTGYMEGRPIFSDKTEWTPKHTVSQTWTTAGSEKPHRYAVVLHIFYEDFVDRFYDALYGVDFHFDLYILTTEPSLVKRCEHQFSKNPCVGQIHARHVPNRGRNFGPFLVEFSKDLLDYDYFLHMHSKRSLYSGQEQSQWANYLIEYLAKDKHVLAQALEILNHNSEYGIYYPVTFWNLPPWVNHWLQNKGIGRHVLSEKYGVTQSADFFAYPAGGMFWAKTSALKDILEQEWTYESFPAEPLAADGTELHALERIIPYLVKKQGYKQLFYSPTSGDFTEDDSFIYKSYLTDNYSRLIHAVNHHDILSFDIFDTIVCRDHLEPDLAKFKMATALDLSISGSEFVGVRNRAELDLRIAKNFSGDVGIYDIYSKLASDLTSELSPIQLADLEFEMDLASLSGKATMVRLVNAAAAKGKTIYFITDTYYSRKHIEVLLEKAGITCPYELFVSSELELRKDSGTMWDMINLKLTTENNKHRFLHTGDSVTSDAQNPGDRGLANFHILAPMDKWDALGYPLIRTGFEINSISNIWKWGPIVSQVGAHPFI